MRNGRGRSGSRRRKTNSERTVEIPMTTVKNAEIARSSSKVPMEVKMRTNKTVVNVAKTGVPPLLTVVARFMKYPLRASPNSIRGFSIKMALMIPMSESNAKIVKI